MALIRRLAVLAWALTQGNGLKELSLLNKDETAEFGTKTEGKNCTNKQNIFPFGCHLHITSICKKKNCLYHWNRAEKQANALKKGYEEVSSLRIKKYFEWTIIELGFRMVWGFMQLRSCYPPTLTTTSAINTPIMFLGFSSERGCKHLLNLHNHVAFVTYHGYRGRVHRKNYWELNRTPGPCGSFD